VITRLAVLVLPVPALLVACGGRSTTSEEGSSAFANPTAASAPTATATITPTPPPTLVVPGDAPGMLLVDYGERVGWESGSPGAARGALVALDEVSGEELAWWPPLNSGQASSGVPSQDGELLAWTWHQDQSSPALLSMIEPATRRVRFTLTEPSDLGLLTWAADGTVLYAVKEDVHPWPVGQPGSNVRGGAIWAIDPEGGEARELATVDHQIWWLEASDSRLVALGFDSEQCCGLDIDGDPFVVTVDTATGELGEPMPIPGLVVGQRFEEQGEARTQMNMLRYPDVAISPDGDRAYVAHADSELVTVIDLGAGTLETVTPTRSQTLLGRLGSWLGAVFVSEASAKGGAYFRRQVELSPDGRWLYVTGTEAQICTNDQYNPCVENAPSGLRVIDTESMEVIAEHEGIGEIAFTADMRRLLGWAWAFDYRGGGESAEFLSYGPFVIDAETHELVAESTYEMGGPLGAQVVPSTNPLYAFMTLEGPGREEAMTNGGNCLETCVFVAVLEVNGATIVATHEYRGFVSMESLVPMP
jgi:hypothetical protein